MRKNFMADQPPWPATVEQPAAAARHCKSRNLSQSSWIRAVVANGHCLRRATGTGRPARLGVTAGSDRFSA